MCRSCGPLGLQGVFQFAPMLVSQLVESAKGHSLTVTSSEPEFEFAPDGDVVSLALDVTEQRDREVALTSARDEAQLLVTRMFRWMIRGYQQANATDLASAVAFQALVAVVPMFLLMVSIAGLFLQDSRVLQQAILTIAWILPSGASQDAFSAAFEARRNSGLYGALGLLGFAWVGTGLISSMARGMKKSNRPFLPRVESSMPTCTRVSMLSQALGAARYQVGATSRKSRSTVSWDSRHTTASATGSFTTAPGLCEKRSQIDSPRPSSRAAPSTW